jgi:hypothetical protein
MQPEAADVVRQHPVWHANDQHKGSIERLRLEPLAFLSTSSSSYGGLGTRARAPLERAPALALGEMQLRRVDQEHTVVAFAGTRPYRGHLRRPVVATGAVRRSGAGQVARASSVNFPERF